MDCPHCGKHIEKPKVKIIGLMKVFSGEEWLRASVMSILPFVEKVMLLTSNVSWIGGKGNPSISIVKQLVAEYPDKIEHLEHDESNQLIHCMFGFEHIKRNYDCDFIQLIDSDELWDAENYQKALAYLAKYPDALAYRTQMFTYIKSPFYRIDPPEPLKPVCFINAKLKDMGNQPRGCSIKPFVIMPDIWCHHFVFVRSHFNKVLEKLIQSHVSESQSYERMDRWIPECWNKLPDWNKELFPNGIHPAIGYGHHWKSIKKVGIEDLPEILDDPDYRYIFDFGEEE